MALTPDPLAVLQRHYPHLSGGQKRVARVLLDIPTEVAFLSTAALGKRVGVSDSTVVRLASAVGYDGYPSLRTAILETLFQHVAPSEQFRRSLSQEQQPPLDASIRLDVLNINRLEAPAVHAPIVSAVSAIVDAPSVFVAGSHSSFAPAYELYYLLGQIRDDVHLAAGNRGELAHQLVGLSAASVVVAFSLPRYSGDTYRIAEYARRVGAALIAITDSRASPLAQLSSVVISVSCESPSFFHSQVASLAVANTLVAEVAMRIPRDAERRLKRFESVNKAMRQLVVEDADEDVSHVGTIDAAGPTIGRLQGTSEPHRPNKEQS